jgi:hypothetical protein
MKRILIVPAGTDNGYEVWESLKGRYEVFCADALEDNPTSIVSGRHVQMPMGFGSDFWQELSSACSRLDIDLVIPTHDGLLVPLAEMGKVGGAKVLTSPPEACRVTFRKDTTYSFLQANGLWDICPFLADRFPAFLRPNNGRGSRSAFKVDDKKTLDLLEQLVPDSIVTEYLPGKEYTVDCLSDLNGELLGHCIRERVYISNGVTKIGVTVDNQSISSMAEKISSCLKTSGPWFFQAKEDSGGIPKLTEINLRVGGTSGLSRIAGFNHMLLATRMYLGEPISAIEPPQIGVVVSRGPILHTHFDARYIRLVLWDLDDTIWTGELSKNYRTPQIISEVAATIAILATKGVFMGIVTSNKLLRESGTYSVTSFLRQSGIHFPFSPILFSPDGKASAISSFLENSSFVPGEVVLVDDSFKERECVTKDLRIRVLDPTLHYLLRDIK